MSDENKFGHCKNISYLALKLKDMKEKEEKFSVWTLESLDLEQSYCHWSEGLTMYITKNGKTIKLNNDEIIQLVNSLPKTIGGSY